MRKNRKISKKDIVFEEAFGDLKILITKLTEDVPDNILDIVHDFAGKSKTHIFLLSLVTDIVVDGGYDRAGLISIIDYISEEYENNILNNDIFGVSNLIKELKK